MSLLTTASLVVTPNAGEEGTLFSIIPDTGLGDMSVTRATTATRVNSAGLVELVPYNLLSYSQAFENSYWTFYNTSVIANNTTAPDGTTTADKITLTGGFGSVYRSSVDFSGGLFTISCYFKKGNNVKFYIEGNPSSGYFGAGFDLNTEIITPFGVATSSNIENLGNDWYRCSVSATANGSGYVAFGIQEPSAGQFGYYWGAQLNEGTIKPYLPTTTRLNIPRADYSTGSAALLAEPQRTNVCVYSSNLAGWIDQTGNTTKTRINSGGADGGAYDRLVTTGSGNMGRYVQYTSLTGSNAIFSVYLRGSGIADITIYNAGQSSVQQVTLTNEWTRYETQITSGVAGYIDWSVFVYGGSITEVSCAQMEFAIYATSYIPTQATAVTRNADLISKTGIASFIGQTEGTIFWEVSKQLGENDVRLSISDGSTNNWLFVGVEFNNSPRIYCNVGGVNQFSIYGSQLDNEYHKLAFAYKNNDFALYVDGVQVITHTSGSVPACSRLDVSNIFPGADTYATSNNKAVALWQTRLDNATLASLTTL